MGLKKYEIITVGSDKRVRALRSWQVGDRYVNIGDVGGIVYDEKTLSQDGACWLFRGNFGFPGARIGGDSIVDVGEAELSTTGTPNVDILGSSVVVGSKLQFTSEQTAADSVVLTAGGFEPGTLNYAEGSDWETGKQPSSNYLRTKAPIFSGGVATTLKIDVPGYTVQAYVLDHDGKGVTATAATDTGVDVTLTIPAGQYFMLTLAKTPLASIALSDVTTAKITFTGTYETKLSIIDSRVEINPATSAGTTTIRPGGTYTIASGAKYPESIIQGSKVVINSHASANRAVRLMSEFIGCNVAIDATQGNAQSVGIYSNVNNLTFTRAVSDDSLKVDVPRGIQATDCDNFAVSPTVFPGLTAARTANMPFIFQGCNVPNGLFYHHAQIANTYKNIDFALAQSDLGKATVIPSVLLVSSEVNGMYRLCAPGSGNLGALIEDYNSIIKYQPNNLAESYNTTIYADAYISGELRLSGTNVFGNAMKHEASNTQNVMAVQGIFNEIATGKTITGIVGSDTLVCVPTPFRISGAKGLTVNNMPAGLELVIFAVNANNTITKVQGSTAVNTDLNGAALVGCKAFIRFKKVNGDPITPADLAGVTVTTYNGCKIVNTGATVVNMKGNIRVEGNATLIDTSVTGTGYFGGNSIAQGLTVEGAAYMKDNASFTKTEASGPIRDLKMTENAYAVLGDFSLNGRIHLSDNARFTPTAAGLYEGDLVMKDNAVVSGAVSIGGVLTMKDNAKVSAGALITYGDITLCGSYSQTASKTWTGKRVIDSQDSPLYDDNVKTQYDF